MLEYAVIKKNRSEHLALTGLTRKEFARLLVAFEQAEDEALEQAYTKPLRQRQPGGGRPAILRNREQRLLFILVYFKTYSIQVVQGKLFDMSQSRANRLIHELTPLLKRALDITGVVPARDPKQVSKVARGKAEQVELIIDGTDRQRQRPKNKDAQVLHYSGKHKTHTDKNLVIVNRKTTKIEYLSQTYAGTAHDKKIADHEAIRYPPKTRLFKDTGFQGYEPQVLSTHQPKKNAEWRTDPSRKTGESALVKTPCDRRTQHRWSQTTALCQGYPPQLALWIRRHCHGHCLFSPQSACFLPHPPFKALTYFA